MVQLFAVRHHHPDDMLKRTIKLELKTNDRANVIIRVNRSHQLGGIDLKIEHNCHGIT